MQKYIDNNIEIVDYCLAGTFFVEACGEVVFRAEVEEYIPQVKTKNFVLQNRF